MALKRRSTLAAYRHQFLFATTWTLYVLYLPQLAAQAGITSAGCRGSWSPTSRCSRVMDVLTGFWIDRVRAGLARYRRLDPRRHGGFLHRICLPAVRRRDHSCCSRHRRVGRDLFRLALAALGAALAPRRDPEHSVALALVLTGTAVALGARPYLGIGCAASTRELPFVLSTLTLVATVAGLVVAERRRSEEARSDRNPRRCCDP